jgi:hypothetical protein
MSYLWRIMAGATPKPTALPERPARQAAATAAAGSTAGADLVTVDDVRLVAPVPSSHGDAPAGPWRMLEDGPARENVTTTGRELARGRPGVAAEPGRNEPAAIHDPRAEPAGTSELLRPRHEPASPVSRSSRQRSASTPARPADASAVAADATVVAGGWPPAWQRSASPQALRGLTEAIAWVAAGSQPPQDASSPEARGHHDAQPRVWAEPTARAGGALDTATTRLPIPTGAELAGEPTAPTPARSTHQQRGVGEAQGLPEESLTVSIGAIHVTVEEPGPPVPIPPAANAAPPSYDHDPGWGGFDPSRHYLRP